MRIDIGLTQPARVGYLRKVFLYMHLRTLWLQKLALAAVFIGVSYFEEMVYVIQCSAVDGLCAVCSENKDLRQIDASSCMLPTFARLCRSRIWY